jgi:hypothetical protein
MQHAPKESLPSLPPGRRTARLDWDGDDHAVAIVDTARRSRSASPSHIRTPVSGRWSAGLAEAGANEVAIVRPDGPVTEAPLEAGLTVVVISPNQIENLRSPYGSASVRVRGHPETSPSDSSPLSAIVLAGARRHQSRPRIGRTRPFERCRICQSLSSVDPASPTAWAEPAPPLTPPATRSSDLDGARAPPEHRPLRPASAPRTGAPFRAVDSGTDPTGAPLYSKATCRPVHQRARRCGLRSARPRCRVPRRERWRTHRPRLPAVGLVPGSDRPPQEQGPAFESCSCPWWSGSAPAPTGVTLSQTRGMGDSLPSGVASCERIDVAGLVPMVGRGEERLPAGSQCRERR